MLTYQHIRPQPDGSYEPVDPGEGPLAATCPVWDRAGEPVDRVAWIGREPGAWWVLHGLEPVLGMPAIHEAVWRAGRLRLFSNPSAWFRALTEHGQIGACILDWARPFEIFDALAGLDRIECDTDALQKRLAKAIKDASTPRIRIAAPKAPAARKAA